MTTSNATLYFSYVCFVASPTIAGGVVPVISAAACIWTTLRYYDIIIE